MQEKESIMVVWCEMKIPSLRITRPASRCRTVILVTEFSIRTSQPLKILITKNMCNVRTFVKQNYDIFLVRTYVTYENILWPNLCYTQKYDFLYLRVFTYENV